MTHTITLALDDTTAHRLKRLAARWQVSQAEAVRRAVALALAESEAHLARPDPLAMLRDLHRQGRGLDLGAAEVYLAEFCLGLA